MARKRIDRKDKKCYREFVWLAPSEYAHLCDILGKEQTERWIDELNLYIGSKGDKYESHYYTIMMWARRAKEKAALHSSHLPARGERGRDAERIIELLIEHAVMPPDFPADLKPKFFAICARLGMNWPRLHVQLMKDRPPIEENIRKALEWKI